MLIWLTKKVEYHKAKDPVMEMATVHVLRCGEVQTTTCLDLQSCEIGERVALGMSCFGAKKER